MKDLIIALFGDYVPVADATGVASLDIPYICGVFLFAIVLYSLFRFLGGFFK